MNGPQPCSIGLPKLRRITPGAAFAGGALRSPAKTERRVLFFYSMPLLTAQCIRGACVWTTPECEYRIGSVVYWLSSSEDDAMLPTPASSACLQAAFSCALLLLLPLPLAGCDALPTDVAKSAGKTGRHGAGFTGVPVAGRQASQSSRSRQRISRIG
jgi:hypothetical protein